MIQISDLKIELGNNKSFDKRFKVESNSFEIKAGQAATIVGSNGSGKTTLLRLISRSLTPASGFSKAKKPLLPITDIEKLFHLRMTCLENIHYLSSLFGNPSDKALAKGALELVGLSDFSKRLVAKISKGEKTRLALAIACIGGWNSILLDEPTTGLDSAGIELAINIINRLKKQGSSILMTSHDKYFIESTSDVIILKNRYGSFTAQKPTNAQLVENFYVQLSNGKKSIIESTKLVDFIKQNQDSLIELKRAGLNHIEDNACS